MATLALATLATQVTLESQMNPLIGPILETKALYAMKLQWDGEE